MNAGGLLDSHTHGRGRRFETPGDEAGSGTHRFLVQQRGEILRTQPSYHDLRSIVISSLFTQSVQAEQVHVLSCQATISIP